MTEIKGPYTVQDFRFPPTTLLNWPQNPSKEYVFLVVIGIVVTKN